MRTSDRLAWRVGATDAVAVLLVAAAVGRFVVGNPATTPEFDRALPSAILLLAPVAVWLGRCHSDAMQGSGRFMPFHVIGAGAICAVAILLALALGPLLTQAGWAQLAAGLQDSHGVGNTIGAFLILLLTVPVYAAIGQAIALGIGGLNWTIVRWCTRGDRHTVRLTSA